MVIRRSDTAASRPASSKPIPLRVPLGAPLGSTDAELDDAAEITAEDIARAQDAAPPALRPYLDARDDGDGGPTD